MNDYTRQCFSIIVEFIIDYEKQITITRIKNEEQCTIYHVSSNQRDNLQTIWKAWTHESTLTQIKHQEKNSRFKADIKRNVKWVHSVQNFAWKHELVNIHVIMMIDILHQLLKSTVMYLIQWLEMIIKNITSTISLKRKRDSQTIADTTHDVQLNQRFQVVLSYSELRHFHDFLFVKQWIDVEQKTIVHQLIMIVTSLLIRKASDALYCARALMNFVMMTQYQSHDDESLRYMNNAIYRINVLKEVFKQFRHDENFNYLKFHVISHYMNFIRRYEDADDFDTSYMKIAHKFLIKDYYDLTNKRKNFQMQILHHNTWQVNMLTMKDIILHDLITFRSEIDERMKVMITKSSRSLDLMQLEWSLSEMNLNRRWNWSSNSRFWRIASEIAKTTYIKSFLNQLLIFIRESRCKKSEIKSNKYQMNQKEIDFFWINNYFVSVHASIECWRRENKDLTDSEKFTLKWIQCASAWQKQMLNWRHDYVYVQEYAEND